MINKELLDEIKNKLTIEQVSDLVAEFGGDPLMKSGYFIAKTICHNGIGEGSHKLYYYDNTKLFRCFTECNDTFDIFELIIKVKNFNINESFYYINNFFNFDYNNIAHQFNTFELPDWQILKKYEKEDNINKKQIIQLKEYDESILKFYPFVRILPWEQDGITFDIIKTHNIRYDPKNHGVIIPHYNIDNKLIGIRERTLIKSAEAAGKYKPAYLNSQLYNHPLSFNLYNINNSKNNIKAAKTVIIFEGEKGCLQYASYFGVENDITVACCGSSLLQPQFDILYKLKVQEIIIAFDKQFQQINDNEFQRWTKKLIDIHNKYSKYVTISFMFDKENLLEYKDSPIDKNKDIFLKLYNKRVYL